MRAKLARTIGVFAAVLLLIGTAAPVHASILTWDFIFDEYGNGYINVNGSGWVSQPGTLLPDLTGSGFASALTYMLPGPTGSGDVVVFEPNLTVGDLVRFASPTGEHGGFEAADRLIFYSLAGGGAPADTGIPDYDPFYRDVCCPVAEINGAFDIVGGGNTYHGVSDGVAVNPVPEPASLVLVGSGLLSAGARWRRRRAEKQN